jgi:hypothetical protein
VNLQLSGGRGSTRALISPHYQRTPLRQLWHPRKSLVRARFARVAVLSFVHAQVFPGLGGSLALPEGIGFPPRTESTRPGRTNSQLHPSPRTRYLRSNKLLFRSRPCVIRILAEHGSRLFHHEVHESHEGSELHPQTGLGPNEVQHPSPSVTFVPLWSKKKQTVADDDPDETTPWSKEVAGGRGSTRALISPHDRRTPLRQLWHPQNRSFALVLPESRLSRSFTGPADLQLHCNVDKPKIPGNAFQREPV